jgi:hypothetical protein|tara:strand:+ start:1133 stop:1690 length:558 start_codon:yes stop_codon:yes gene_type:complete
MSRIFEPVKLDMDTDVFFNVKWEDYRCSCIQHQKVEQKDLHPDNKMPKSLVIDNTAIHQKFFDKIEVDYFELGEKIGIGVISVSVIKQEPGNIIPKHRDMFFKIKEQYPNVETELVRANIFLEDWKSGHYIEFDEQPHTHWKANEGFILNQDVIHLSANAGLEDKYTLQISGFYNDSEIYESTRQ